MKKIAVIVIFSILLVSIATPLVRANDISGKLGLGIGNPYIALKYGLTSKLSGEVRGAFGSGITVYGIRGCYNFNPESKAVIFLGGEADLINFDTEGISGEGNVLMVFVGLEYFLSNRLALSTDIGPALITVSSEGTSVSGLEWVFNVGINFYL